MKDLVPTIVSTFTTLILCSLLVVAYTHYRDTQNRTNLQNVFIELPEDLSHIPNAYTSNDLSLSGEHPPIQEPNLSIRRPTKEMLMEYYNASKYGVWIDDKKIENADLINYDVSDFEYYMVSTLLSNTDHYGLYEHHVSLLTPEGFKKLKAHLRLRLAGNQRL